MKKSTKKQLIAIGCGVAFCLLIHFYYSKKVIPDETTSWMNFSKKFLIKLVQNKINKFLIYISVNLYFFHSIN